MSNTSSPYIKYLSHNPIKWCSFSQETLRRAYDEDKMIFIHIGEIGNIADRKAARSLFSDKDVIEILNENFISIPIDVDDYPDAYLLGWDTLQLAHEEKKIPINLFMMPDFTPITSTSNCIPDIILMLCENLLSAFYEKREALSGMAEEAKYMLSKSSISSTPADKFVINKQLIDDYVFEWSLKMTNMDNYFKKKPFYLKTSSLLFLAEYVEKHNEPLIKSFLDKLCLKIIDSPMTDPINGGLFFEMSDSSLAAPLFEKKLNDNLLQAQFFAKAYTIFHNPRYMLAATNIIDFINEEFKNANGGYFNTITLDDNIDSIYYYHFTLSELEEAFPNDYLGVAAALGMNCSLKKNIKQLPSNSKSAENLPKETLILLKEIRASHSGLLKDKRNITAGNCIYTKVLCSLSNLLQNPKYIIHAIELHHYLMRSYSKNGSLKRYFADNAPSSIDGTLMDYVSLIEADISLYEETDESYFLDQASDCIRFVINQFYNKENGMFFKASKYNYLIPIKRESNIDGTLGSTNSIMCSNLLRMYKNTQDEKYLKMAEKQLNNIAPHLSGSGPYMGNWAMQLMLYLSLLSSD